MKKRVRVYKPGGQTNQPTQEQIVNYISQRMSADDYDGDTDALKAELAQAGIEDTMADDYISYVSDNLGLEDDTQLDEETQLAAEQEQANAEEEQALLEEQQEAEEEARQAKLQAMYDTNIDMSTTEDTPEDEESYMQYGGTKPSKRSFINKYTKLAKKQMGGNTPSPGADDVLNGREAHVNNFLGAVRNTAQDAILKQEAEQVYNSIYGAPQVGAFQDGGIHQEEIDPENPLHHLSTYGTDTRHIFSDDMYTQNDVAAMEQFGGNTGQGLYKFIGGGDNESADEQYQDADIDFNQEQYQMGGFRMPRRSGRQYTQAVGSPYYTATGEAAAAPDLVGRQVSSVNVTKRGIFGRPKAYTVNYNANNEYLPSQDSTSQTTKNTTNLTTSSPEKSTGTNQLANKRQPVADWMMRSGIPGIKQMGARMTKSGMMPEIEAGTEKVIPSTTTTAPASNEPYYPPMNARAQRRERRDDAQLNRFLGNTEGVDVMSNLNGQSVSGSDAPKTYAEAKTQAKVEDKKEEEKINERINPAIQANQIQAKLDQANTIGGINKKALNYDYANDPEAKAFQNKYPSFKGQRNEEFWSQQQPQGANKYSPEKAAKMKEMGLNPDIYGHHYLFQHPDKFKEYGGPVDYTEYAYGGDISIPELYKAQVGVEQPFDPNKNNLGDYLSFKAPEIEDNETFAPPTEDNTIKPLTKEQELLKYQRGYNQQLGYVDPKVAGESISGIGTTDKPILQKGTSEDYQVKKDWDKTRANFDMGLMAVNAGLDIADQIRARKQENQMLANITAAETNYGISNADDRGDYDPNSGLFRPDQMGAMQSKYGGGIYAMGGNTAEEDEDVQYMTQEEIDDFIANGGELEYL